MEAAPGTRRQSLVRRLRRLRRRRVHARQQSRGRAACVTTKETRTGFVEREAAQSGREAKGLPVNLFWSRKRRNPMTLPASPNTRSVFVRNLPRERQSIFCNTIEFARITNRLGKALLAQRDLVPGRTRDFYTDCLVKPWPPPKISTSKRNVFI